MFCLVCDTQYTHAPNDADFAVLRDGGVLFLLFAKSESVGDWINNFDFPAVRRCGEGSCNNDGTLCSVDSKNNNECFYCHRGFLSVFEAVLPFIADEVASKSNRIIYISGYSHGGALAALCHEYVTGARPDLIGKISGYGFGMPRVFWGAIPVSVSARMSSFTYVRNAGDIVTHLPPAALGYRHVGERLQIGKIGKYGAVAAHYEDNYKAELKNLNSAFVPTFIF